MDIKGIFTNRQITELQQPSEPTAQETSIQSEGVSAIADTVEQPSQSNAFKILTDTFGVQAQQANHDLSQVAERQNEQLKQKEKLREIQDKMQALKDGDSSFFSDIGNFLTGNDPGASEGISPNQDFASEWVSFAASADELQGQTSEISSKFRLDDNLRSDLGHLLIPLDAMHGQPQNYDDLQQVVRDLQNLLNSSMIPNEEKLKLQAELNQLDQISHQMPIQPQNPDQNFQEGLQLLTAIRSDLSQYLN